MLITELSNDIIASSVRLASANGIALSYLLWCYCMAEYYIFHWLKDNVSSFSNVVFSALAVPKSCHPFIF